MPKRKYKDSDDLDYLSRKIKKLERKLCRRDRRSRSRSKGHQRRRDRTRSRSTSTRSRIRNVSPSANQDDVTVGDLLDSFHELSRSTKATVEISGTDPLLENDLDRGEDPLLENAPVDGDLQVVDNLDKEPATATGAPTETATVSDNNACEVVDNDLLEILGADPSTKVVYGIDIHSELASRLQHIATAGLAKELRKELNAKYLIPANCVKIGAPSMNPEIRDALTEPVMKRDKGIEARQNQLASAIAGLAELINCELKYKEKDNKRLKQMMDVCRILCDIQHSESETRRSFAIFSIKKEFKQHIGNTKIDKNLFGEDLTDTLKSAKAIIKSGSELKTKPPPKPRQPSSVTNNLNWKSPAPARRQQQSAPRGREAAPPLVPGPAARSFRNVRHAGSSKPSQRPSKPTPRY